MGDGGTNRRNTSGTKEGQDSTCNYVLENVLLQIAKKKKTTKEIWDSLKARYVGADRTKKARLQTLKEEFHVLQMMESETVDEFCFYPMGALDVLTLR